MKFISSVLAILFVVRLWISTHKTPLEYLRTKYGLSCVKVFRTWEDALRKWNKNVLDLEYLNTCKAYDVAPKFVRFKLYKKSLHGTDLYRSWQTELLDIEIESKKQSIKIVSKKRDKSYGELSEVISFLDRMLISHYLHNGLKKVEQETRKTHQKKLSNLGIFGRIAPCDPERVIFNFSSVTLSSKLRKLLAFGLDFGLPVFKLNYIKYFHYFEKIAYFLRKSTCLGDREEFNEMLRVTANKFFHNFKPGKVFSVFTRDDIKLLKEFSNNKNIVVSKPDKGRGVVVVDKMHYLQGVSKIIANSCKFELISQEIKGVARKAEDQINNFLLDLKKKDLISSALYKRLHVAGSGPRPTLWFT